MFPYILRRLALIPLTLLGIIAINFVIAQIAPGGPVEQLLAQIKNTAVAATARVGGGEGMEAGGGSTAAATSGDSPYRGAQGLDPAFIAELNRQFGFDQPAYIRFGRMIGDYLTFD
ncbi:MAG: microcin ABC transporter permease, partial [Candidatus Competibacteraceae bacterium]|nr:microcin ABC transporter permease [Candidatus Competibacteraceae bacterium]